MIISHSQIKEVSDKLKIVIKEKDEKLKQAIMLLNTWKEIEEFLEELRSTMKKMKSSMSNEEKEIQNIHQMRRQLEFVNEINTNNPSSEKSLLAYVESQSIITSPPSELTNCMENIITHFEKMEKLIINKSKSKWISNKEVNFKKEVHVERKYEEKKPVIKRHSERDLYKIDSKPLAEALAILATEERYMKNKEPDPFRKIINLPDIKPIEEKPELIKDVQFENNKHHNKENESRKPELLPKEKRCGVCMVPGGPILTISCCGEICANCFKQRIIDYEPKVLLNPFEAERRQVAMCVCPLHKTFINFKIIRLLFSDKELERFSVDALKRQKKNGAGKRLKHQNICADCKGAMKDNVKTVKVGSKHKICEYCFG